MSKGKCESENMPKGYNNDDILIKNIHEAIDFIEQTPRDDKAAGFVHPLPVFNQKRSSL